MQFGQLKRREFITLLGSAAAWPPTARGQNGRMARIAFLNASSPQAWDPHNMEQFKQGLEENSLVEGRNITIDYVWAEGNAERLRELAMLITSNRSVAESDTRCSSQRRQRWSLASPRRTASGAWTRNCWRCRKPRGATEDSPV